LEVAAELEVVDALLKLNKNVVELHVELSTLLKQDRELLLDDDSLVDLLEELVFGWVLARCRNKLIQAWDVRLYGLGNLLFLLFKSFILGEMGDIFLFVLLEYGTFVSCSVLHFHESFNCVVSIEHCSSIIHNLFLLKGNCIEFVKCLLDCSNCRVAQGLSCGWVLWNGCSKFLTGLTKKLESSLVSLEFLLDLNICC